MVMNGRYLKKSNSSTKTLQAVQKRGDNMRCNICQRDLPIEEFIYTGGTCKECWPKRVEEHYELLKKVRARKSELPKAELFCNGEWLSESEYFALDTSNGGAKIEAAVRQG